MSVLLDLAVHLLLIFLFLLRLLLVCYRAVCWASKSLKRGQNALYQKGEYRSAGDNGAATGQPGRRVSHYRTPSPSLIIAREGDEVRADMVARIGVHGSHPFSNGALAGVCPKTPSCSSCRCWRGWHKDWNRIITGLGPKKEQAEGMAALKASFLLFYYSIQNGEELVMVTKGHDDAMLLIEDVHHLRYAKELEEINWEFMKKKLNEVREWFIAGGQIGQDRPASKVEAEMRRAYGWGSGVKIEEVEEEDEATGPIPSSSQPQGCSGNAAHDDGPQWKVMPQPQPGEFYHCSMVQ